MKLINETGKAKINAWLDAVEARRSHIDWNKGWESHAERVAEDAAEGEDVIIEMRGSQTISGTPETLKLCSECFDTRPDVDFFDQLVADSTHGA